MSDHTLLLCSNNCLHDRLNEYLAVDGHLNAMHMNTDMSAKLRVYYEADNTFFCKKNRTNTSFIDMSSIFFGQLFLNSGFRYAILQISSI